MINLGGYTKGARNDVFAARPCPVQMQLMGYAGTLGAGKDTNATDVTLWVDSDVVGWCDYLVCDPISCPPDMCASERWRMKRREASRRRSRDPQATSDPALDFDADADPEEETDEWVLYVDCALRACGCGRADRVCSSEKYVYMPVSNP